MDYKCSCCGEVHDGWPALAFNSPYYYDLLSEERKQSIAQLSSDFCIVKHKEQTDRFIRVMLCQKVKGFKWHLDYGLWVSLSEESFDDYYTNFDNKNHVTTYFGWLCSTIPPYESTLSIPTLVHTKPGDERPEIVPKEDFDHPFVRDYYEGISKEEAEKRIHDMMKIN